MSLLWCLHTCVADCSTHDSGTVELVSLPSQGALPPAQVLQIPQLYNRKTGAVNAMEWSSDGHVLAVGWQNGWAVFSVGGRCLAWGLGVEYEVNEDRFTDAFMYGMRDLVSVRATNLLRAPRMIWR